MANKDLGVMCAVRFSDTAREHRYSLSFCVRAQLTGRRVGELLSGAFVA